MKKRTAISTLSATAAVILVLSPITSASAGCTHVFDSAGNPVKGGVEKNCVHTGMFKGGKEILEACGAEKPKVAVAPAPKPAPVPVAPAPAPKPAPVKSTTERMSIGGQTLFATNSSKLSAGGQSAVDNVISQLATFDKVTGIAVTGHTDSRGSEAYNQQLSERRAAAVRDYMVNNGVDSALVTASGSGESEPVADNNTADGRQQNRRVDIDVSGTKVVN